MMIKTRIDYFNIFDAFIGFVLYLNFFDFVFVEGDLLLFCLFVCTL